MNALERLAHWVSESNSQHSEANYNRAVNSFIDTLACNIAGIQEPVTNRVYQSIQNTSSGNVSALGFGRTSAANAALVNATASHSQDFDDYNRSSVAHTSTVLIPTSLAVAEQLNRSGARCLDASIVGLEVMAYLGSVINMDHYLKGWHATSTLGSIGAAAAASRLMGLDAGQTAAAMSMVTSMIGGFKLQFGTMTKALHAGLAAQAGINAAIMASNGITASAEVFDGDAGITSMWSDTDLSDFAENILPESGKLAIEREGLYVKCYPSCGYTSRAIDGMISLMTENDIDIANIEKIEIEVPDRHAVVASFLIPQNPMQAKFSFPYCLSVAALYQTIGVGHFSETMIINSDVQNLMQRVEVIPYETDPGLDDLSPEAPDRIRVTVKDGRQIEKTVRISRGSPEQPLSRGELYEKFWSCVDHDVDSKLRDSIENAFEDFASSDSVGPLIGSLKSVCHYAS